MNCLPRKVHIITFSYGLTSSSDFNYYVVPALAQYSQWSPLSSHPYMLLIVPPPGLSHLASRCFLHAGGDDPHQATTAWLDRYFGMGACVVC